ncbi:MAG: chemotaxis protein CheC [Gemmatimonadota bacterium]
MSGLRRLLPAQLDALKEVANIGAGHAATALSEMTNRPVLVTVPLVSTFPISQVGRQVGGSGEIFAGVLLEIVGDLTGRTLLLFDRLSAYGLCDILLRRDTRAAPGGDLDETQRSALKELGNILTSAYANALSEFLGLLLLPSVPDLLVDRLEAILSTPYLSSPRRRSGAVLCVETRFRFRDDGQQLSGNFLLVPDLEALPALFRAVRLQP